MTDGEDDDFEMVQCEGCAALLNDETCHHDVEGVPLCDECWEALRGCP